MIDHSGGNPPKPASGASPRPDGEVARRATRRTFTREYKRRIVREAEAARGTPGGVGALLRREGIYSASLVQWRRELEAGELDSTVEKKRGPKPRFTQQQKDDLKKDREIERLRKKLATAEALLDLQKKFHAMLQGLEPEEGDEP